MYESFYKLREKPFSLLPDPEFMFLGEQHRMALALLEYGILNQAGFTVITGEIGAGKTTLIRHLLNGLDQDITVGLVSNTQGDFAELLQWIMLAWGLDGNGHSKVENHQRLIDFMISEYARNHRTVLIIDEAQNLSTDTLEELRMLSNINADKHQVLQVIMSGQPQLRSKLRQPELVQFAQRITADHHLRGLAENETGEYIRHRLSVSGGDPDLVQAGCYDAVHRFSGGIPRLVNLLCDTALVYAYSEQAPAVTPGIMAEVIRDKRESGLLPDHSGDHNVDGNGKTITSIDSQKTG